METDDNKLTTGIVAMILIALGVGGGSFITADQFEVAYVCTSNDKPAYCTGNIDHPAPLSDSMKSCYYIDANGNDKYKRCYNGIFQSLDEYSIDRDIDPEDFMYGNLNDAVGYSTGYGPGIKQYSCPPFGEPCYPTK